MLTVLMSILLVLTVINSFLHSKKDKLHKNEVDKLNIKISSLQYMLKNAQERNISYIKANGVFREQADLNEQTINAQADRIQNFEIHIKALQNKFDGLGLNDRQIQALEARAKGNYIYEIYKNGAFYTNIRIPIKGNNPDYRAKKSAGIKDSDMKGVKAVRWTI